MTADSLVVRVELSAPAPPAGVVVLENKGATEVRIWEMGNSWGDEALSFERTLQRGVDRILPRPQVYTMNVPASLALKPSARHEIPFNLGDGSWRVDASAAWTDGGELVAVYDVPSTPEALAERVFTGRLRSAPVQLAGQ